MKAFKKDFIGISTVISENTVQGAYVLKNPLVETLVKMFKASNPKFDEKKFKEACGYTG